MTKESNHREQNFTISCIMLPTGDTIIARVSNRQTHESGRTTVDVTFAYKILENYDEDTDEYEILFQPFLPYLHLVRLDLSTIVLSGPPSEELLQDYVEVLEEDYSDSGESSEEQEGQTEPQDDHKKKDGRVLH